MTHIDLSRASFRAFNGHNKASRTADVAQVTTKLSASRALASAVYYILLIPFAIAICAIVAFAVLPLHSDSRWDDSYD